LLLALNHYQPEKLDNQSSTSESISYRHSLSWDNQEYPVFYPGQDEKTQAQLGDELVLYDAGSKLSELVL